MTKDWRRSQHKRHADISEFARATFNDPQYDLTALTSNLDKTLITDKSKEILQKIIYKSLYVGEVANRYQTQIKGLTANSRIPIVSQFCEYSEWNFAYLTPTGYNPWQGKKKVSRYKTCHIWSHTMDRTDSSITMVRSQSLSRHHADPFHNDSLERCP